MEGVHLVEEALKSELVEEIIVSENFTNSKVFDNFYGEVTIVSENVFKSLTDTVTTQGVIAVCKIKNKQLDISKYSRVLIIDQVQDPGNLGTIIRTADAFSFDCIILGKGTTSIYGQKVIRSTQGSNFHIDCFDNIDILDVIPKMEDFDLYATSLKGDRYLEQIDSVGEKVAVIFGNEGSGVSEEILDKVNNLLKINMTGQAESLNVAVAAGIVMHYIATKCE
ncbi:RNA methyltransferase [Gemella sanguinis]|uniref:RNA methyltransferase n=1 Tax=Gemella sanguinis TaxID=84135 RepID=A0A2N6SHC9_9BACL|nr:RNA methyltransferase [Gemella sanguinis]